MEAVDAADDLVAAIGFAVQPGHLDGRLDRFGAAVAEEAFAVEPAVRSLSALAKQALRLGVPGVGHVNQLGHLLLDRLDHSRRTVAEQVAAPARKEIEIAASLGVPHVRFFAAYQAHGEARVVANHVAVKQLDDLGGGLASFGFGLVGEFAV